jgi:hypothetical protein
MLPVIKFSETDAPWQYEGVGYVLFGAAAVLGSWQTGLGLELGYYGGLPALSAELWDDCRTAGPSVIHN